MKTNTDLYNVSIIVIGLNEEKNLPMCFESVKSMNYPQDKIELIYVDNGSTDRSVEIAKKYADRIFIEKSVWPCASLVRNRGAIEAKYDIIHFSDGDIKIDRNYILKGVKTIVNGESESVYGYINEGSGSFYSQVLMKKWDEKKPGLSNATGTGGTFKKVSFFQAGGYDERIKRGEETDLGVRFYEKGFRIILLDTLMGTHNGDLKFFDFIKYFYIAGISTAQLVLLNKENAYFKVRNYHTFKNIFLNFFLSSSAILAFATGFYYFPLLLFVALVGSLFVKHKLRTGKNAMLFYYQFFNQLGRPIMFVGQAAYFIKHFIQIKILGKSSFMNMPASITERTDFSG